MFKITFLVILALSWSDQADPSVLPGLHEPTFEKTSLLGHNSSLRPCTELQGDPGKVSRPIRRTLIFKLWFLLKLRAPEFQHRKYWWFISRYKNSILFKNAASAKFLIIWELEFFLSNWNLNLNFPNINFSKIRKLLEIQTYVKIFPLEKISKFSNILTM